MMDREKRRQSLKRRYGNRMAAYGGKGPGGPGPGPGHGPGGRRRAQGPKRMPKNAKQTVKRLLSYLNEDKGKMGLAFFCVIVNTVATLAGSYLLRPIINTYIVPTDGSRGDAAGLLRGLFVMAAVYLAGVVTNYFQAKVMLTVAQNA